MGNSTKPGPLREEENVIYLPTSQSGRESGNHPVGNDMRNGQTAPPILENIPQSPDANGMTDLRASIGERVGLATITPVNFSEVRKKALQNSSTGRRTLKSSATNPGKVAKKGPKKAASKAKPLIKTTPKPKPEVAAHPDDEEISNYPVLVEFLKGMDEGYDVVANVFCKMRIALRESMVEAGAWEGAKNDMPDSRNWFEPISLEKAVERLESSELNELVDRVSNPRLPDDVRDLADDELFGKVAHTILLMERRFLRFKFDDAFVSSVCDQLVETFGQKERGIRKLIVTKLGTDYALFTKKQAEQRWGGVKIMNSFTAPSNSQGGIQRGDERLVIFDEDPDNEK